MPTIKEACAMLLAFNTYGIYHIAEACLRWLRQERASFHMQATENTNVSQLAKLTTSVEPQFDFWLSLWHWHPKEST